MRNLKLQYCKQFAEALSTVRFLLLNPNESAAGVVIYLATENKLYAFNTNSQNLEELSELPGIIIGCEYLALENEICLATNSGEVLLVNPETKVINEGTFCEVGIEHMAWSPDQEVVVFVTKIHKIVVMTCAYEPVSEQTLSDQCFGSGQFVAVGWGKKETQFHGSEGKPVIKAEDISTPVEELCQDIKIAWRADASYFAVSYVDKKIGRTFKVFDKEGSLKYTCEKLARLQPDIAWRPSGTWIAMPQILPNKSTVALIEKNGLRHREIVLPFSLESKAIRSLKWSLDSDILCLETINKLNGDNILYLYTVGNYHWYLKQVLRFNSENPIAVYNWDNRIGEEKTLHVILENGHYLVYKWHFSTDKHCFGVVAVIDGNRLLITDLSKTVLPPPMCNQELEIDSNVNACGFIKNCQNELLLFAYDTAHCVHIFKTNSQHPKMFTKMFTLTPNIKLQNTPFVIANISWFNKQNLIAIETLGNSSKVLLMSLDQNLKNYYIKNALNIKGIVNALCIKSIETARFLVQTSDGRIQEIFLTRDNNLKIDKLYAQLTQGGADQMEWFTSRKLEHQGLISLRTNQNLYINAQRIADDVTSFCLAGNYLAFTKLVALYFVHLSDQRIVSERKIERGAKIVTIIDKESRTVLQLPRGNLEAISPRVLALEIVGALLEDKCYYAAMDMLRKQRINLNIICDHNMVSFVENLKVFLQEIHNSNWLNLFLSDLQNEDFTTTMYASNYKTGSQIYPEGFKIEQKIAYLCEKLCELMEQNFEPRFRLPIITAYVKIGKADKALDVIWKEKQREASSNAESKQAEDALKYLLYLVDINELYNLALGSYDFGLVLFVAQKSQKDPREFLPFLNELRTMEPNYRKFTIDKHLKRNEKALYNITQCGEMRIEEAIAYIKQYELFQQALKYYKDQAKCYQQICRVFADYLRANGKLENASIMYERSNDISQAFLCAKNDLDWKRTLALAKRNGMDTESVALSLVPALEEHDMHSEAFDILRTYGNNPFEAIKCLLRARLFLRAIFEAQMMPGDHNLIDSVIKSDLMTYASLLESNLCADRDLFVSYKQRLLRIRQEKLKSVDRDENNYEHVDIDEYDLISDTTSVNSSRYTGSSRGSTGKTFRSSKNRRKHERKILCLKPGNPFEDIALVDALHSHITKVFAQQQHVRDICKALMELQEDKVASSIQHLLKNLLILIQDSLDEIWIPEMLTAHQFLTGPNIDYTQLRNEQRYSMITPQKRFKPQLVIIDWEHVILR